jgi:L-fuconolactonase
MNPNQNRRDFIKTSVAAAAGAAFACAQRADAAPTAAAYEGVIIDTHTHFYDPTRPEGVPWPSKDEKRLYRRVLPADYRALPKPHPVAGTVVVEASAWVEDNQWILDLAAREPFIAGFVGNLVPGTTDFQAHLKRFAADPIYRGIRISGDRVRAALKEPRVLDDIKALASRDLALDLLGGPDMLPDVVRLARAIPDLRMIIDHVANLRIDGSTPPAAWREGMRQVAEHPNVYCKVSGLVEGTGRNDGTAPASLDVYTPVLNTIWSDFGPTRLIYGSNWPVSELFAPCTLVQQIVTDFFSAKGRAAAEQVFWKNAKAFYKYIDRK